MYCSIIGYPLNKPRSVPLWKNYFKRKNYKIEMFPIEVKKKDFHKYILKLKKKENFLATAVTMPFKKNIIKYIDKLDKLAKRSNSVNLVLKSNKKLYGYNTDIYGALESTKKINKKNIMIFGFGGAGSAIYCYFSQKYKTTKFWIVSSKKRTIIKHNKNTQIKKKINNSILKNIDLFINCSPLGSSLNSNYKCKTPLNINQVKIMKKNSTVFDIVYKPKITILNKLCMKNNIKYINGLKMNTLQAKKALEIIDKHIKKKITN